MPHENLFTISRDTAWADRQVTVMGLGSFGGGMAAVRFLAERGARVLISDTKDETALAEPLGQLADLKNLEFRLGGHDWSHLKNAELLVVNPAIRPDNAFVKQAVRAGIPTSSEIELFWQLNRARVIGVTGSNGKSTTTALTHHVLKAAIENDSTQSRKAWCGGNIGRSLLPHVDEIQPEDWVVLELSSFQLKALDRIHARPDVAIVTNFAPNHLDWHGSLEDYRASKQALLHWQTDADYCVLTADNEVSAWPGKGRRFITGPANSIRFHETQFRFVPPPMKLRGRHNRQNALNAFAAVLAATLISSARDFGDGPPNLPPASVESFSTFEPLPHRLAPVATAAGRTFYDDSIATTPESAIAALDSFDEPIVLLAGGSDKQLDLSGLAESIASSVKAVALLGSTGPVLERAIAAQSPGLTRQVSDSLSSAFHWAIDQSSPGDVILLSPGCASLDWFRNFQDRGNQFAQLARQWAGANPD